MRFAPRAVHGIPPRREPIGVASGTEGEEVDQMSDGEKSDLRWVLLMVVIGAAIGALIMLGPWAATGM